MVFFKSLVCCSLIVAITSAAIPRIVRQAPVFNAPPQEIQVTGYNNNIDPATGSFEYGYQQNDGVDVSARGYLNPNGNQVIEGNYGYADPAGVPVQIQYTADENGYQAVGDAIPQPDPIIAKSVSYLRSLPASPQDEYQ